MATVEITVNRGPARQTSGSRAKIAFAVITGALTILAVCVQGYHPFSEDGGLYLTSMKKLLDPLLYPSWSAFSSAPSHFSLFVPALAAIVRVLHLPLMNLLLAVYIISIWSTLLGAWLLASRCFTRVEAQCGAATLLALWMALPVAGTSLMLMDPYLTARSISTPCGLLALVGAIDLHRYLNHQIEFPPAKMLGYLSCAIMAELAHPLMATYALGFIAIFLALSLSTRKSRAIAVISISLFALTIAACIYFLSPVQTPEVARAAQTRAYWFIDSWHWYELFGLVAPIAILRVIARRTGINGNPIPLISRAASCSAAIGVVIAILFARTSSTTFAVARLQPLRIFQFLYLLMVIALGAYLGEQFLKRTVWRWTAFVVVCGAGMFSLQRQTYPHSSHLEFPGIQSGNQWEQAFTWIRGNTPADALFALDAKYIAAPGEDSQNFRAIAERSALPDYSKDGGLAAIAPVLAAQWNIGESAQTDLDAESDAVRRSRLASLGVSWLVLSRNVSTDMPCPYSNVAVKVCRLVSP